MASRSSGGAESGVRTLWGGSAAGTMRSLSSFSADRAARAAARCPRWGGLKLPP